MTSTNLLFCRKSFVFNIIYQIYWPYFLSSYNLLFLSIWAQILLQPNILGICPPRLRPCCLIHSGFQPPTFILAVPINHPEWERYIGGGGGHTRPPPPYPSFPHALTLSGPRAVLMHCALCRRDSWMEPWSAFQHHVGHTGLKGGMMHECMQSC